MLRYRALNEPVVLMNLFEVPPEADEAFMRGWAAARDFLREQDGYVDTSLHRSLGEADFRFVNIAHWESPGAFQRAISAPAFPGRELPFPSHPSLYRVIRADEPDGGEGGVTLINAFELPQEANDETFVAGWERARGFLRTQPGYVGTRLHQSIAPDARFRFVNVGWYESPEAFRAAIGHPAFPGAKGALAGAHPGLYEVVAS